LVYPFVFMMRRIFWSRPLLLAAGLGSAVWFSANGREASPAAGTNTLTLAAAIRVALESNPELHAASARVEAAAGRAYQARQWSNPELELNAEDWPVNGGRGYADAKQTIGIAQTLPFPGKKSLDRQISGESVKFSDTELALRRTETVRDVKATFYRVLAAERLVAVSAQLAAVAESSASTARKRVDAGAAPYQEQLRAEVLWEQARTELAGFERDQANARQIFATLLGRADLAETTLLGALAERPVAGLLNATPDECLANHPSLGGAQSNLKRAQLEHRRARLAPYPDVKVGVAGGRIGATDESIIQIGFTLPLPIFDRGQGKQQETQANVQVAEAELHGVRQQLQREWANAQKRYRTAAKQVDNYRERILPKATEALRLVQAGFEQGKFGFIDLADTQRTTAEVRLAYLGKLLEMNLAQAELEALLQPQPLRPSTAN
jgi:cobalt-zinc-cadmium efflux system outer membrane protein